MSKIAKPLTAAQIEKGKNLPPRLLSIGREVEAKFSKFRTYEAKATDMAVSIKQLLVEAGTYCDKSGFDAFRKKFCPSLGKSRTYELLAIASGKKSVDEMKAEKAARQAKHIARLKAAARPSVVESNVVPLVPRGASHGDNTLQRFTAWVLELVLLTATGEPSRFVSATVKADDLVNLGTFLLTLADLQKSAGKRRTM